MASVRSGLSPLCSFAGSFMNRGLRGDRYLGVHRMTMPLTTLGEENIGAGQKTEDAANAKISDSHRVYSGVFAKQPRGAPEKSGDRDRLGEKGFLLMRPQVECFTEDDVVHHRS